MKLYSPVSCRTLPGTAWWRAAWASSENCVMEGTDRHVSLPLPSSGIRQGPILSTQGGRQHITNHLLVISLYPFCCLSLLYNAHSCGFSSQKPRESTEWKGNRWRRVALAKSQPVCHTASKTINELTSLYWAQNGSVLSPRGSHAIVEPPYSASLVRLSMKGCCLPA